MIQRVARSIGNAAVECWWFEPSRVRSDAARSCRLALWPGCAASVQAVATGAVRDEHQQAAEDRHVLQEVDLGIEGVRRIRRPKRMKDRGRDEREDREGGGGQPGLPAEHEREAAAELHRDRDPDE